MKSSSIAVFMALIISMAGISGSHVFADHDITAPEISDVTSERISKNYKQVCANVVDDGFVTVRLNTVEKTQTNELPEKNYVMTDPYETNNYCAVIKHSDVPVQIKAFDGYNNLSVFNFD